MSLNDYRAQIATALSTVDSVTGYPHRPKTLPAGAAWPLLTGLTRADGLTFVASWRVLLVLPQNEAAASDWMDGHVDALVEALSPFGFVDEFQPGFITTSGGEVLVLEIHFRNEG